MNALKKYVKVHRWMPLWMLCWQIGFAIFGMAMVLIINAFLNQDPDFACLGTVMSLCGMAAACLVKAGGRTHTDFSLAISMGMTRRSYLACNPVMIFLWILQGFVTSFLIYHGELCLYTSLYPGYDNDIPLDGFFQWWVLVLIIAGIVLLDMFLNAWTIRFGMKGFGFLWIAMCLTFTLLPRTIDAYQEGGTSLFARIGGALCAVPIPVWIALAILAVLAMLVFSLYVLLRAEVR